jgi:hypothetical protein
MDSEDTTISLNPIEIELLLAAVDNYEGRLRKERSGSIAQIIRAVRQKLTIASQRCELPEPDAP